MIKVGFNWLKEALNIKEFTLTHESFIGKVDKIEVGIDNTIVQTFNPKYELESNHPLLHIEFALKYDDLHLAFLKEAFLAIGHSVISSYVLKAPNRKYSRIIGFLYEFTTKKYNCKSFQYQL